MKHSILFIVLSLLFIGCVSDSRDKKTDNTEDVTKIKQYAYEEFDKNISVSGGIFTFDEQNIVYTSNESGIFNLFSIPANGGDATQLTNSTAETYGLRACFPNDGRIVFTHDNEGDENNHIYLRLESGEENDLTPFEGSKNVYGSWNNDQTAFYFETNKRDPRYFDLYKMSVATMDAGDYKPELVFENNDGYVLGPITDDEETIAVSINNSRVDNNVFLLNINTGDKILITAHKGEVSTSPQQFSQDGQYLYLRTDKNSDFTYIQRYDVQSGEAEDFFRTDWDVNGIHWAHSENYWSVSINEDARRSVYVFDVQNNSELVLPEIKGQDIVGVHMSKSEKKMRFTTNSSSAPINIYSFDTENEQLIRLTNTLNPAIDESHLVAGEVIRYKSFDGVEIPAILYMPRNASTENKVPCMLFIHGGPGGQSSIRYSQVIQYVVNHGYAILAVNNRGSSGYGKKFFGLDDRRHGEDDLQDCVESKKYLATLGTIDMDKVGIMGGSYGGCMTMAALTFTPEEFAVGVNIFGVTNWLRTLRGIPAHWAAYRKGLYKELGNPDTEDSVRLRKISPLFHAKNITKPLMVLQGANDVRVIQAESDEIVAAARANGVPVEYVLFPDEGHGFRKKANEKEAWTKILLFLDKYLKGTETGV